MRTILSPSNSAFDLASKEFASFCVFLVGERKRARPRKRESKRERESERKRKSERENETEKERERERVCVGEKS